MVKFKVTKVTPRTETVEERGKEPQQKQFEDVTLEVVGGDLWAGSPAATPLGFTVDAADKIGHFREGDVFEVAFTRA